MKEFIEMYINDSGAFIIITGFAFLLVFMLRNYHRESKITDKELERDGHKHNDNA